MTDSQLFFWLKMMALFMILHAIFGVALPWWRDALVALVIVGFQAVARP